MKKWIINGLITLLVLLGGIVFYIHVYLPKVTYETVVPVRGDINLTVSGVGKVGAKEIGIINAEVSGRIDKITADEGDRVEKRRLLVHIDPVDLPYKIEEANLSIQKATLEREASKKELQSLVAEQRLSLSTFHRMKALYRGKAASQEAYDKARTELQVIDVKIEAIKDRIKALQMEIKRAHTSYMALKEKLKHFSIYAPTDGYVISKQISIGESVMPAEVLMKIVDPALVRVKTYIDERLTGDIKQGDEAVITLRSKPAKRYHGSVVRIEPQTDPVTLEKVVEVAFATLPIPFYMNEEADVVIYTQMLQNILKIPAKVIVHIHGKQGIWTVRNGKAHFMGVKVLGLERADAAVSGIERDTVILVPSASKRILKEGMRVLR